VTRTVTYRSHKSSYIYGSRNGCATMRVTTLV
jgi:hypothetical protein